MTALPVAEMLGWVDDLAEEIDRAFACDNWALFESGDDAVIHRYYSATALRHCTVLLHEIGVAVNGGLDMSARILARAHLEAFLTAMYVYFGGVAAVNRMVSDGNRELIKLRRALVESDWRLRRTKRDSAAKKKRIILNNERNAAWNTANPGEPPRPVLEPPHVPQLPLAGRKVRDRVRTASRARPGPAEELTLHDIVAALTKWAATKGDFGRESFEPLYIHYRILSTIGGHPGTSVYDAYLQRTGMFIRVGAQHEGNMSKDALRSALWSTAFLATRILGDAGSDASIAHRMVSVLEAGPGAEGGWSPE